MKMNHSKTTLSDNIVFHRKRICLTQKEMAEELGIKHSRYGAWEEGRAKPPAVFMIKLADIFDITVDKLLKPREDEAAGVQPGSTGEQQGSEDQPGDITGAEGQEAKETE